MGIITATTIDYDTKLQVQSREILLPLLLSIMTQNLKPDQGWYYYYYNYLLWYKNIKLIEDDIIIIAIMYHDSKTSSSVAI